MFSPRLPSHFSHPQLYEQTLSIPISVVSQRLARALARVARDVFSMAKVAKALARVARDVFSLAKVARALARAVRALLRVVALLRRVVSHVLIMTVMTTILMTTIILRRVERLEERVTSLITLQRLLEASPGVIRPASRRSPPKMFE